VAMASNSGRALLMTGVMGGFLGLHQGRWPLDANDLSRH
jgi:hypothetical protein